MQVYLVANKENGHKYVGITTGSVGKRWREHRFAARHDKGRPLYRAIRKYGEDAFSIEVLATASSKDELKRLECEFIQSLRTYARDGSGYNLTLGGDGLEKMNSPRGAQSYNAVLTEEVVRFIRDPAQAGVSNKDMQQEVQKRFGLQAPPDALKCARNGKSWNHLDVPPVKVAKFSRKPALTAQQLTANRAQLAGIHAEAVAKSAELRRGKRQANAKLSVEQVRDIFFAEGSGPEIGLRFGVHKKIVYGIKKRLMHTYMTKDL
jgi:hypothetical protein